VDSALNAHAKAPRGDLQSQGLYFEDFEVGLVVTSPRRTVTESDIVRFAGLSGDFHPLHTDEEYARRTAFRGRIAHGLLVQSMSTGLVMQTGVFHGTLAALESMVVKYRGPVRPGDTILTRLEVVERQTPPNRKRGWVRFVSRVDNQRGECVVEGEWRTILVRRVPGPGLGE
jgi:acyl dehydratase